MEDVPYRIISPSYLMNGGKKTIHNCLRTIASTSMGCDKANVIDDTFWIGKVLGNREIGFVLILMVPITYEAKHDMLRVFRVYVDLIHQLHNCVFSCYDILVH